MSACFYIVVEGEDPGFDTFVNGHALARNEDELENLATSLRVAPLLSFYSTDRNSMAALLEQGAGDPAWEPALPEPQWFPPEDGLETVQALLGYLERHPASFGADTRRLHDELSEYERVLAKTNSYQLRWHLAVSFE